ncbi:MAG: lectin-like domain-containing protein, partial [Acidimicrobiales bacterium]
DVYKRQLAPGAAGVSGVSGVGATLAAHTSSSSADEGTNRGGLSRDGWYPEASLLTPANVTTQNFGELYSIPVVGQVYAQPVMDGSEAIIATEQDWVYGVNQVTGAKQWAVQLGADVGAQPFDNVAPTVSTLASWQCDDLEPYVGVTSTPVVDPTTGVIYVTAMEQLADGTLGYFVHALNPQDGSEEPGFPVAVQGAAQNNPAVTFNAYDELQRPALTLVDGVIYMGFSGHCDSLPYNGFVAGVTESGRLAALWTNSIGGGDRGGIWQAGGGFVSDASGQIIVASGNGEPGDSPAGTIAGTSPPTSGSLTESVVRLVAQKNGSLTPTDFFAPYDALTLDGHDLDLGSGAPVLLPTQFGDASVPQPLLQVGKEGYVYLLNPDNLGGVSPGDGGVLAEAGVYGGAWTTPGVWPGDGGYVYVPTGNGGTRSAGNTSEGDFNVFQVTPPSPAQSSFQILRVATGPQAMGFGSSGPIVTSDGSTDGSAVVWVDQLPYEAGSQANLQAYAAVPSKGSLTLLGQWPITDVTKFASPGVGDNRLYVPTKDGAVLVFGLHAASLLTGHGTTFPLTTVGTTATTTLTFVASQDMTIDQGAGGCGVCARTDQFAVASTTPSFTNGTLTLGAGELFNVKVGFSPTESPGYRSDVLRLVTSLGEADFTLAGTGRASTPWVTPSTRGLTLPAYVIGSTRPATRSLTLTNFGTKPARVTAVTSSLAPLRVTGLPAVGSTIAPGRHVTLQVSYSGATVGTFHRVLKITTNSPAAVATSTIQLVAAAHTAPRLAVSSTTLAFGSASAPIARGTGAVATLTLTNTGGTILSLSSISLTGPYTILNPVAKGFDIPPKASEALHVLFAPNAGSAAGSLTIRPLGLSATRVTLNGHASGTGVAVPAPGSGLWVSAGSATTTGSVVTLTPAVSYQAGSTFWSTPITGGSFVANFTASADNGSGADGLALVLADASALASPPPAPLGANGNGVGFGGVKGLAVVIGEFPDPGTPGTQWVGVADGANPAGGLHWLSPPVALAGSTQDTPNDVTVELDNSVIDVWVNGVAVTTQPVTAPASFLIGFSAGTGLWTNDHQVAGVTIEAGST